MLDPILTSGLILAGAVGSFGVACKVVKDWSGCSTEEAAKKIRNLVNGKITVPLDKDPGFYEAICQGLKDVIGDKRYSELAKLDAALRAAGRTPVIACGSHSGLPYFVVAVRPKDDFEKQTIEVVLTGITKEHLAARGLGSEVLGDWRERMDIKSPCYEIRYPNDSQDRKLILDTIVREGSAVLNANRPLTDDTEEEDLTDD